MRDYIRRADRVAERERIMESLGNEYAEEYNLPQTEVWSGCVRATNKAGAGEQLLFRVGMKLLHEQKADYVSVENVKKAPKGVQGICGMENFSEKRYKLERNRLNKALRDVRRRKSPESKERELARVNKRFANSPARWGKQRCFCGDVVLTRSDISKKAIKLKRKTSRARKIPSKKPFPGGANYWMAE